MKEIYFNELEVRMDEYCKRCHGFNCIKCTFIPSDFLRDDEIQIKVKRNIDELKFKYDIRK